MAEEKPDRGPETPARMAALMRRAESLLDDVAQRSTDTTRTGLRSLRRSLVAILQSAIAAAVAYLIAFRILGHPEPFFAPIAAVISLGISLGNRLRRSVELVLGVAVGVLVADGLAVVLGRGTWQIALFVALAMAVAVIGGGGPLVVNQGAASAILIATLAPFGDPEGFAFSRFIDALVGGLVGLAVNALLLPLNPIVIARRAANNILDEAAGTLSDIASALEDRDQDRARNALKRATAIEGDLDEFDEQLDAGREITRLAPARWRLQGHLTQYMEASSSIDSAVRNIRVLARRAVVMLRVGETVDPRLLTAIRRLAEAVRTLRNELAKGVTPRAARLGLMHAAELATETIEPNQGFSANVVVAQMRSTVLDLLIASGLSRKDAERIIDELIPR